MTLAGFAMVAIDECAWHWRKVRRGAASAETVTVELHRSRPECARQRVAWLLSSTQGCAIDPQRRSADAGPVTRPCPPR